MLHSPKCIASWISHILDSFYQHHKNLYRGGGGGGVSGKPWSGGLQQSSDIFKVNDPQVGPIALKLSQNIAKSMPYIINQSCRDFQQGGCLYKPTSDIQWTPKHLWTSDRPEKQASAKADPSIFGSGVLVIS